MAGTGTRSVAQLRKLLIGIVAGLVAIDLAWVSLVHFRINYGGYIDLLLLSLALLAASQFYRIKRPDARLSAMLFGTGYLCQFSAAASVLNYFLLTMAGRRIDSTLAIIDRRLGFDWPALMAEVARHPLVDAVLYISYTSILPLVALVVCLLGRNETYVGIYRLCIAMSVGALICIGTWTAAPSFGAISVYPMPEAASHMKLALDHNYAQTLIALLAHGPGYISPVDAKGLIGFPSYHAVMALLIIYYTWPLRIVRWPMVIFNLSALIATPIQGGHHMIDVLAAIPVAAISLFAAGELRDWRKTAERLTFDRSASVT